MTNEDEPLMRMGAPTQAEKLLWERHSNQLLSERVKDLELELEKTQKEFDVAKEEFKWYKETVNNNHIAQMLNKLNRMKDEKVFTVEKIKKLQQDNEKLLQRCIKYQIELRPINE
jgi:hypothetical protein